MSSQATLTPADFDVIINYLDGLAGSSPELVAEAADDLRARLMAYDLVASVKPDCQRDEHAHGLNVGMHAGHAADAAMRLVRATRKNPAMLDTCRLAQLIFNEVEYLVETPE